jgi:sphingomyelin phosphodiesterase
MELDDKKFKSYRLNQWKQPFFTPECDEVCRINAICTLRADRAKDRCNYTPESGINSDRLVILDVKEEEACGIQLLKKKQHWKNLMTIWVVKNWAMQNKIKI